MFSGCKEYERIQAKAPIIDVSYITETREYLVLLDGQRSIFVPLNKIKVTVNSGSSPTLHFLIDGYGRHASASEYKFEFSDYEQAKQYLSLEKMGENVQAYAKATSSSSCFVSTIQ